MADLNIRNIPAELLRRFKSAVALRGETLRSAVLRMLESEVKRLERRGKK